MLPLFSPAEDDDEATIPSGIARFCTSSGQADAVLLTRLYAGINDECAPSHLSAIVMHAESSRAMPQSASASAATHGL